VTLVHTTIQPSRDLDVDDAELESLIRQGLLYPPVVAPPRGGLTLRGGLFPSMSLYPSLSLYPSIGGGLTAVRVKEVPSRLLYVDAAELESLTRQNLLYTPGWDLYVVWETWLNGPEAAVTNVSLTITDQSAATVLASTSPTAQTSVGGYFYRWPQTLAPGLGTYTAHWSAVDLDGNTVTASETFTLT
jgi:hypothetical protein